MGAFPRESTYEAGHRTTGTTVNMNGVSRRRFVQQAALAAAGSSMHPLLTLAEQRRRADAEEPTGAPLSASAIREFTSTIAGQVIAPDATTYDLARLMFNRAFDRRPALIVRCVGADDVVRALEFAQRHQLPLAVRGGGHSRAGLSVCEAGVVVDLSPMNRVEVDADQRVVRAEAGALTVHVDAATQRFGLATTLAGCPTVGIAGLTLGGGEGLLMSKFGAACDNLIGAQLVTADGRHLEASHGSNPDLFWGIRGGGGNFGIATTLKLRLHPVNDVLAGTLAYAPGRVAELLQAFAKFVAAAPDEMNVVGVVSRSAPGAQFRMLICHCGDQRRGNELLRPLRALHPELDDLRIRSYVETNGTINPAAPAAHFQTNLFLPQLGSAAIATIAASIEDAPANARAFIVPLYGAITRVAVGDTAFPLRQPGFEIDLMARWSDPIDQPRATQWVRALRDALQPRASGVYVNQLGETSEELVKASYGPNYARLSNLKRKYDPRNVFHSNQNVRPA